MLSLLDLSILFVTILSVFFDLAVRRIPNWIIAFGLIGGLLLNGSQGFTPFVHSIAGFVVGVSVLIVPFALGWMGAGDVKYFGVVGALVGIGWLPRVLFYSILSAGVLAVGHIALNRLNTEALKNVWTDGKLAIVSLGRILPESISKRTAKGADAVPWGVAIGAGTLVAYYFDPTGRWAGF
ncbi:MAG: prepilin peptidase [Candidatus Binatia bacterium]